MKTLSVNWMAPRSAAFANGKRESSGNAPLTSRWLVIFLPLSHYLFPSLTLLAGSPIYEVIFVSECHFQGKNSSWIIMNSVIWVDLHVCVRGVLTPEVWNTTIGTGQNRQLRHHFITPPKLSPFRSHFPERFRRIIALTNHPLGSGAWEIDVPSFQNNGGALWVGSWCHNFRGWQTGQGVGTWPVDGRKANGTLGRYDSINPCTGETRGCGPSSQQTCSITSPHSEQIDSLYSGNQPLLIPPVCQLLPLLPHLTCTETGNSKDNLRPCTSSFWQTLPAQRLIGSTGQSIEIKSNPSFSKLHDKLKTKREREMCCRSSLVFIRLSVHQYTVRQANISVD